MKKDILNGILTVIRKNFDDIHINPDNNTLHHYTIIEGLFGIIKSKTIYATHAAFLNDKSELSHAKDLLIESFKEISSELTNPDDKKIIETLVLHYSKKPFPEVYIASFSSAGNDLSQWRAYGKSNEMYSLAFNYIFLANTLSMYGELTSVIYDDKLAKSIFKFTFFKVLEHFKGIKYSERIEDYLIYIFDLYLPVIKNSHFSSEKEYRLIIRLDVFAKIGIEKPKDLEIFHKVSNKRVVPYLKIPLINEFTHLDDTLLEYVMIGPNDQQDLSSFSVASLLDKEWQLMMGEERIKKSNIPFRGS